MTNTYIVRRKHVKFRDKTFYVGEKFCFNDFPEIEPHKRERLIYKLIGLGRIEKCLEDTSTSNSNSNLKVERELVEDDLELELTHGGGPWWILPDGRKIMGKEKALNMLRAGQKVGV